MKKRIHFRLAFVIFVIVMSSLLIRNGVVITMNDAFDIVHGDVSIRDGRIAAVGPELDRLPCRTRRRSRRPRGWVLPGFVQTHLHLCQTLFRGSADDLTLMDWLRTRVWPDGSGTHSGDPPRVRAASITELLVSGTTAVLTMETVHETDVVFEAAAEAGIRATIGKCMMDGDAAGRRPETAAGGDPRRRSTKAWPSANGGTERRRDGCAGRVRTAVCRLVLTGTARGVASLSEVSGTLVHTHASESRDELTIVRRLTGRAVEHRLLARLRLAVAIRN